MSDIFLKQQYQEGLDSAIFTKRRIYGKTLCLKEIKILFLGYTTMDNHQKLKTPSK